MSIIAGIYNRHENCRANQLLRDSLKRLISRNAADERATFENERAFFVKVDVGAFGENGAFADDDGNFSMLAGEPLLTDGRRSREADLIEIHRAFDALDKARGVFCAATYKNDALCLMTDKLGIRPLYYYIDDDVIVFASQLRILEELDQLPKKMNLRAVSEIVGLGYALADRTPYENIFLLRAGEIVEFKAATVARKFYWRWDDIKTSDDAEETILAELYERFKKAVARRLLTDKTTIAYLSGGLDSRCIVGALRDAGADVYTFNFALPNTQDQILGREYAAKAGVIHTEIPKQAGDLIPDYSSKMAQAWRDAKDNQSPTVERPALVWSGEGGSVALGHVHLSRGIVELMRSGKTDAAIDAFIERENIYVSPKYLQTEVSEKLKDAIKNGIADELDGQNASDAARRFYLFLMLNDQHRKLAGHFENLDLHRLEFQLPFFDSDFFELIVAAPIEICLEHRLYVKWLYLFPETVTTTAWQAYPGHEPCPIPVAGNLSYQWDSAYQADQQTALKKSLVESGAAMLRSKDFPKAILNKNNLRLILWIYRLGWRDYGYVFETAPIYHKFWRKAEGRYVLGVND